MQLISYKTNIKNQAGIQRLSEYLDPAVGSPNWQLDIHAADKTLTVFSPGIVSETKVLDAVRKAGFRAGKLDRYYSAS